MNLLVPCAAGVEASVKRQLKRLGYGDCPANSGRVSLEGDWHDIARLNVFLRSGERVLLVIGTFEAHNFDELYDGVFALPWEEYLSSHSRILMDGKCVRSTIMAVKAAGGVAKKAIVGRLKEKLHLRTLDEKGERTVVGISVTENRVTVTLDTSGDGLHKRGYRTLAYDAPLKETTAAAMIESSYFRSGKPFADLFCGSGTLPIEAAMYALHLAPGVNRDFDFTKWKCAPQVLKIAREEAQDVAVRNEKLHLIGADISERAISIARYHAARAGVAEHIEFRCGDMRHFASGEKFGILMSNPPYGERLGANDDLAALYRDFSKVFRRLPDWSCYLLTAYAGAEKQFGKPDKIRKLYNANLECAFLSYFGKKPQDNGNEPMKKIHQV